MAHGRSWAYGHLANRLCHIGTEQPLHQDAVVTPLRAPLVTTGPVRVRSLVRVPVLGLRRPPSHTAQRLEALLEAGLHTPTIFCLIKASLYYASEMAAYAKLSYLRGLYGGSCRPRRNLSASIDRLSGIYSHCSPPTT